MAREPDFFARSGDTLSPMYATLIDADGVKADLSQPGTVVKYHAIRAQTRELVVDEEAIILDDGTEDERGRVMYDVGNVQETEPLPSGDHYVEFEVTMPSGKTRTYQNGDESDDILLRVSRQGA